MQTKTVNGDTYYLHQSADGKRIWKLLSSQKSDMVLNDVQDSATSTLIQATVQNVKQFPCRISTSITGMNNGARYTHSINGNSIELDLEVQWNTRRPSELLRVFVNQGTVHQQSFQIEIDDSGNASVLTGSTKVTTGKG